MNKNILVSFLMAMMFTMVTVQALPDWEISVDSPVAGTIYKSDFVLFLVSANTTYPEVNISVWVYDLNGINITFTPNVTLALADGDFSLVVYAIDTLGNISLTEQINFTVDVNRPLRDTLEQSGDGLGSFLNAIVDPVTNIILAIGIIGGILSIFYGIASAFKRVLSGNVSELEK